ncbi:MAG: flavodoxin domain-containing protein, partial [Oscillospiraceae bacterium]|nr:flavodoxin domain-containing protein [Oscillospiraceae bacterium]
VLLSNDAFGQHYCTSGYFNDEVDETELYQEALKYYAGILAPFTKLIERKIEEVLGLGLDISMIAPSHGVIWRKDPLQIVHKYMEWSKDYHDGSVVIAYDCLYEATGAMAAAIGRGLAGRGVRYKISNVGNTDVSDLITELFCARGIIIGSSTINNTMHRSIAGLLDDVRGHKLKGKLGAAFGSYGWSGEAPKMIAEELERAGIEVFGDPIRFQYTPTAAELDECVAFGDKFAAAL